MKALSREREWLKVADEVFLVMAALHRDHPDAEDFSTKEFMDHAAKLNLNGRLRPGVQIHFRMHCVANIEPNPGDYRMLFATERGKRRLLKRSDPVNPKRMGKIFPDLKDIDPKNFDLVIWARERYEASAKRRGFLEELLALRGSGRDLWADEHADEYVARLRSDWE